MSATETTAHEAEAVHLDVTKIQAGDNPRKTVDDESQAQLNESVRQLGVITPITVRRSDDGEGWTLIAGQRRLMAALTNGLETIPALVVYEENPERQRAIAIVENLHRDPLKPMEEARAFQEATATMSQKQIAEAYSISEHTVRDRISLLSLPESLHEHVDSGAIPIGATRVISKIAEHSENIGEAVANAILAGKVGIGQFAGSPDFALRNSVRLWNEENNEDPILLFPATANDLDPETVGWTQEQVDQTRETAQFVHDAYEWSSILSNEAVDAARQFGCLLELSSSDGQDIAFITDPEWLFEYGSKGLEEKAERIRSSTDTVVTRSGRPVKPKVADMSDDQKQERQAQREKDAKAREEAVADNEQLGVKLLSKLTVKLDKRTMYLIAVVLGEKWKDSIGRGCRYTVDELRTVTEKRAGGVRVEYASQSEAYEWWLNRLKRLKSADEIVHHVLFGLASAEFCDEQAVPQSQRSYASPSGYIDDGEIGKLLLTLTRSALPTRMKERAAARQKQHTEELEEQRKEFTDAGVPLEVAAEADAEDDFDDADLL